MRHHLFGAVIGQRQQAAARVHHRRGAFGDGGEGIDRNVHRHQEIGVRGIDIAAAQFVLVGKADGVDDKVDAAPFGLEPFEQGIDRVHVGDVAFKQPRLAQLAGQRHHALFQRLALIAERHFGALRGEGLGDAPGDGFVVGEPHDEAPFARHKSC